MNLPKFPKKLNRACKLTEEDLTKISQLRNSGLTLGEIANTYNVTVQAIWYVLKTPEEKLEINRRKHSKDTKEDRIRANIASRQAVKRKWQIMNDECRPIQAAIVREYRKNNPDYMKRMDKKRYYSKKIGDKWFGAVERSKYRSKYNKVI